MSEWTVRCNTLMLFHPKMEVGFEPTRLSCCSTQTELSWLLRSRNRTYDPQLSALLYPWATFLRERTRTSNTSTFLSTSRFISILILIENNTNLLYWNRWPGCHWRRKASLILHQEVYILKLFAIISSKNVCHCWHYKYRWVNAQGICVEKKRSKKNIEKT